MKRYIDADKFIEWLDVGHLRSPSEICYCEGDVKTMIDMQPTADVVEVRHGEWKDRYENKYANHLYECSLCGEIAPDGVKRSVLGNPEIIQVLSPYCPTCGAKMDGEGRENGN